MKIHHNHGNCAIIAALLYAATVFATPIQLQLGPPPESFFPEVRVFLEQLVAAYNGSQGEVTVVISPDNSDFAEQSVSRESIGDIVFLSGTRYGEQSPLAQYAAAGFLAPLDEYVNAPNFGRKDYFGSVWDMVTVNDQTYGIPLLVRAWAVGVNPAYCDLQQLAPHIEGWDSLLHFMETAEIDVNGDGVPDDLMSHTTNDALFLWEVLFLQYGGDPNNPDSFRSQSLAWQQATEQTLGLLVRQPSLFVPQENTHRRFEMYSHPIQFVHNDAMDPGALPLLRRRSPEWLVLPPPGTAALPNMDTTIAAISVSEPERERAAWGFLAWLSSPELMAAIYPPANLVPLRRSVAKSLEDESMQVFAAALERVVFQRPMAHDNADMAMLKQTLRSVGHEY